MIGLPHLVPLDGRRTVRGVERPAYRATWPCGCAGLVYAFADGVWRVRVDEPCSCLHAEIREVME